MKVDAMDYHFGDANNWINGRWTDGGSETRRDALNPATGRPIGSIAWSSRETARLAIDAARVAQPKWARVPVWERAALCDRIAGLIVEKSEDLAELVSREQGKPIGEARAEIATAASGFRLAASEGRLLEGSTIPAQDPKIRVMTFHQPRGVYALVTPWNFPVNIPVEYLAPCIVTGNAAVWVPAPTTSLCAVALARILGEAGVPTGVVNLVTGEGATVGDEIVASLGTDAIGFTGSAATGKVIASRGAGKPMLLEMGGNGPAIILDDADLDVAAQATAIGCFFNAGQTCSASERVLVHEKIYDAFADRMVEQARRVVLGDPVLAGITMGPLNNLAVARKVAEHVADAVERGAEISFGGYAPHDLGSTYYYAPTVLRNVADDSLISREETFGPVAPLIRFRSDDEALAMAAANRYGLVASVFTEKTSRAFRFIEELPAGIVNVNAPNSYWEIQIPFGGKTGKDSGFGRVGGRHTLLAMTDIKTACINVG